LKVGTSKKNSAYEDEATAVSLNVGITQWREPHIFWITNGGSLLD
jgi:hypothetical protein